jgi:hypothetical protein
VYYVLSIITPSFSGPWNCALEAWLYIAHPGFFCLVVSLN